MVSPPPASTLFPYTTLFRSLTNSGGSAVCLRSLVISMSVDGAGRPTEVTTVICVSESTVKPWTRLSRSEEHTSELQSHHQIVCRLLLEKIIAIDGVIP